MSRNSEIPIAGGLDVALPKMATAHQRFNATHISDVEQAVLTQMSRPEISARVTSGMTVAIGAGSRGVANIDTAVRATVQALRERGAEPFIFPAMGSHAGATAEGQQALLAGYGITEDGVGAPVRASMDTVQIAEMADGTPLHIDRHAHDADGIVLINRIKPHTTFRGAIESGIAKMIVIGMGKIQGATHMHWHGMDRFPEVLPEAATTIMEHSSFLFGVGMVENAYDQTAIVETLLPNTLLEHEAELQAKAKSLMGRLYFSDIDLLLIDQMGKEISGAGFDPNITGRNNRGVTGFDDPRVQKIVVLGLTDKTKGNATGLGLADVITKRLFDAIDYPATYGNVITSAYLDGALIPISMPTDQQAIQLAVKTLIRVKQGEARIVRIRDTLSLDKIAVSEPMLAEVDQHADMSVTGEAEPFAFAADGTLNPM
tara:strand:- start:2913 stop:4202 length:1290 start_codon:yes stop_codon:yes gene_type:complete